ncbi:regulatory protein GemA [Haemophilus influenzae]|uniref:regulatory protein GemA n=1 Tax=Haemophilus influenzae TaxID=727 RepID=UPI000D016740|nr:regulatory protein GemA [Haemophilus influenzae]PRJ95203.1 hypothetical protein BV176_01575 [Haemophilus influenzae]PRK53146.1 hypothetical protein BV175_00731 [Haemophilus influenzae]
MTAPTLNLDDITREVADVIGNLELVQSCVLDGDIDTAKTMYAIMQLIKVLEAMENKVFKKTTKRNYSPSRKSAVVKSNIAHKIRAIWIEMSKQGLLRDGSETALNKWVRGVVNPIYQKRGQNIQILNVGALDDQMASLVLEMLKRWQMRKI